MDARFGLQKRDDGTAQLFVDHVKNGESGFTLEVRLVKVTVELTDGPCETVAAELATDATGALQRGQRRKAKQELTEDQRSPLRLWLVRCSSVRRRSLLGLTSPTAREEPRNKQRSR